MAVEPAPVRACLRALEKAPDLEAAEAALSAFAQAIAMPLMAWAPDIGRPHFDPHMDAFLRRHGWSEEILSLWWDRHVMLKMPLYLRCRVEHLPFASNVVSPRPDRSSAERAIADAITALGHGAMVTVPIILPKGRIAMLTWVGPGPLEQAQALVDSLRPELLATGHVFMAAVDRAAGRNLVAPEELSQLTPREWDCLRLLAQGYRDHAIAQMNQLAPTTVRFHLDNVVRKLGAANRTHAVALAAQLGMLGSISP